MGCYSAAQLCIRILPTESLINTSKVSYEITHVFGVDVLVRWEFCDWWILSDFEGFDSVLRIA